MDEILYSAFSNYFHALEMKGYMSYSQMQKLLVLSFYRDFVFSDYRGLISKSDYMLIERALDCLYGTTCLIPYPDYLKMSKLHIGEITELSHRLKTIEDTTVLKPIDIGTEVADSDVYIQEAEEQLLFSFAVTPTSVYEGKTSVLRFKAEANKQVSFELKMLSNTSSEVIYGPVTGTSVDFNYSLVNPEVGSVKFVMTATDGASTLTEEQTVVVQNAPMTITSFTVTPLQVYTNEEATLEFSGTTSRGGNLSIKDSNGTVLCTKSNANSINYAYTFTPSQEGIFSFTMDAVQGDMSDSRTVEIEVIHRSFSTMYYGNSATRLTTGESIKALANTIADTVEDIYDNIYYYIAVHSSKTLKSIINRGVEPVTDNFILKDESLVINEYGTDQIYKLYECSINEGASSEDMYIFNLTINIE